MAKKLCLAAVLLFLVLSLLFFPLLSCSKSNPVNPDAGLSDGPSLREMVWIDDRPVAVEDERERRADEFPWDCGPASAMLGGDVTLCAWTSRWETGTPPNVILHYDIFLNEDL